jgi:hypothetical protein
VPIVPDLAAPDPSAILGAPPPADPPTQSAMPDGRPDPPTQATPPGGPAEPQTPDPLTDAVARACDLLTDAPHIGLAHLPTTYSTRLTTTAAALAAAGLPRIAASINRLAALIGPNPGKEAIEAWVDAYLRISTAAESL